MSTVMVVDDMAIFRDPIAASLRLVGHRTVCAANGREALALVRSERPDLILLDLAMPVMDGLAFLKALRADPHSSNTPVILLSAISDKQHIMQAAKLGAREYLLKSRFSLQELLERVKKCLTASAPAVVPARPTAEPKPTAETQPAEEAKPCAAATSSPASPPAAAASMVAKAIAAPMPSVVPVTAAPPDPDFPVPQLMTRDDCLSRAKTALQAKTLSGVVAQVISLAASPRSDMSQLATLIGRDPMLSARVLQTANSAAYMSNRGAVTTIGEAVRHVGCATVRNVAAALGIFEMMPQTTPDGFNPIRCWQHSFAVAQLCEKLTAPVDPDLAGAAYLVGLCHDLGEILFYSRFAGEFQKVLDVQARTGKPRDEIERTMLGMTHGELVLAILQHLGLPDSIRMPLEAYHEGGNKPDAGRGDGAKLAQVLRLADLYANGAMIAASGASPVAPLTQAECKRVTGQPHPPCPDTAMLRSEVISLSLILARLSSNDEKELAAPLYAQREVKLWLARDAAFSNFDPVATALAGLATIEVYDRLPQKSECESFGGLVVCARAPGIAGFTPQEIQKSRTFFPPTARTLWLVSTTEGSVPLVAGLSPVKLPVTLQFLADFAEAAESGNGAASALGVRSVAA